LLWKTERNGEIKSDKPQGKESPYENVYINTLNVSDYYKGSWKTEILYVQ